MDFRFAERKDVPLILYFIKELADYEKMLDEVVATEEILEQWLFDKNKAEVIFSMEDGVETGFALFFHNFSTFLGRSGVYLEDLYVRQRAFEKAGRNRSGKRLWQTGMVVPGLEQAKHRFLSFAGSTANGRLDSVQNCR